MAQRINVDVVIDLVSEDVRAAIGRLTGDKPSEWRRTAVNWSDAQIVRDSRRGYVHQIDESALADWANDSGVTIKLLVKPGDYVFPGAPIGLIDPSNDGAAAAIRERTALAPQRSSSHLRYTRFALMAQHGPAPSILLRNEAANATGEL